jgi:hypothetical protein
MKLLSLAKTLAIPAAIGGFLYFTLLQPGVMRDPIASGEVEVVNSAEGSWKARFTTCRSGEHIGFFGVDIAGEHDRIALRVARDPVKGLNVLVRSATSDKAIALTNDNCKGLVANVRRTNTTVNDIRLLDGDVSLDCDLPSGGHARLKTTFEGCN